MNRSSVKTSLHPFFLAAVALILATAGLPAVYAAQNPEKQLQKTLREIRSLRTRLNQDQSTVTNERAQLEQLETTYQEQTSRLRALAQEYAENRRKNDQLLVEHQLKQVELVTHRDVLSRQLTSAHLRGQYDIVRLLLSQRSPTTVRRQLTYYHYLNRARMSAIADAITYLQQLKQLERRIDEQALKLSSLQKQTRENQQQLEHTRDARLQLIAQITHKIDQQKTRLDQLIEDKKQLEKLLEGIKSLFADIPDELDKDQPFSQLKGHLPWPVDRFEKMSRHSNGLLLHRAEGTQVKAVAKGRVVFSDWFRGLGFLIIIDHGNDYMSLYGQNQNLLAGLGQWVQQNEPIAITGQSGGATQPALYFEIRAAGKPQDPTQWCRAPQR